jgi:hypothetical protein
MVEQLFTARREEQENRIGETEKGGENDETEDTMATTCATPLDAQALSLEYKVW